MKDETFRAYLADPDFLLSILPISKELNRILKRIFCIDPMRRIRLPELKERIRNCRYFTRTAEVDRWEQCIQKARKSHHTKKQQQQHAAAADLLPPSPPATPCSGRSRSSSPAIWQQRIDHNNINEKQQPADNTMPDAILTSMLTTLVV